MIFFSRGQPARRQDMIFFSRAGLAGDRTRFSFAGPAGQETWHDFFSRLAARAEAAGLQNRHGPSLRLGSFLTRECSETQ